MNKALKEEIRKLEKWMGRHLDNCSIRDWSFLCHSKDLSEEFMREFKDKINWKHISRYQELSKSFIIEFKDRLCLKILLKRDLITQEFIDNLYRPVSRFELMEIE
ncbi:MAG TPA: hypothetical protein VMZ91_14085 [Candidatus Paceibacterota bacterium]|nr:hypothetical protein [Candidatus Paceibacterota bacterium]